jgi:murein DD-endopeptidase MepM/ murein hydrolase activator NlpD
LVHVGQTVAKGDLIARSGDTGFSTGPHLHYEVRQNGVPIDPTPYM